MRQRWWCGGARTEGREGGTGGGGRGVRRRHLRGTLDELLEQRLVLPVRRAVGLARRLRVELRVAQVGQVEPLGRLVLAARQEVGEVGARGVERRHHAELQEVVEANDAALDDFRAHAAEEHLPRHLRRRARLLLQLRAQVLPLAVPAEHLPLRGALLHGDHVDGVRVLLRARRVEGGERRAELRHPRGLGRKHSRAQARPRGGACRAEVLPLRWLGRGRGARQG